jgi:hypothetical protein
MASICVDRRSQTYLNKQTINPGPTVNSDGSYTLNQIDVFAKELADNIVAETNNNPIQKMVNKFGDDFGKSIDFINGPFRNNDTKDYPSLNNRFQRGNISNLEMADFMESFNYSPNGVQNQVPDKLLGDLEKYYAGDIFESILGGFCNSMNNLFNQIDAFYDLIGEVDGIINDISAAYTKFLALKGKYEGQIDKALVEQTIVEALMKQIKEKILNSVVKIYQKVMDAIDNFDIIDQRLQAIGNQNTSTAIRNGAIRFSKERRQDDINSLNRIWESDDALSLSGYEKVSVEPIKAEDYKNLPNCMAVMKGSDGTFGVEGKVFEEKENDKDKERLGFPAYTHLDLDVKVYLKRLQEIYGNKMIITNGWVSTEYTQYKNRPDDAHLSGLVIDIKMDAAFKSKSVEDQAAEALNAALGTSLERDDWTEVFTKNARKSGFKGVIIYNNHIHLDTRDIVR